MIPRIGIVGAGAIAQGHIDGMRAAGCEVVAVADPFEAARKKMSEKNQIKAFASLGEMRAAEKLDAVHVCVPNTLQTGWSLFPAPAPSPCSWHTTCPSPRHPTRS